MKELLKNSISSVHYKIYVDGVLTDATSDVTVKVDRAGVEVVPSTVVPVTAVGEAEYKKVLPITTTIDGESVGVLTDEGVLDVTWSFTVGGQDFTVTEEYDVVTPYCDWDYFSATTTYAEYLECERVARYLIHVYCGQEFGQEYTTYAVEGHGTRSLALPRRLQTLETVTWIEDGSVIRPGNVIGSDFVWELVGENWTIRRQPQRRRLDPIYSCDRLFERNVTYNVKGVWGYSSVPTPVEEAAKILVADLLCTERKYRDKYLDNIKMGDWRLQFTAQAFQGTGNVIADQLLKDYRLNPGVGLI